MNLALIGDELDQGIVVVDRNGAVTYDNRPARDLLGREESLVGAPFATSANFALVRLVDRVRETCTSETHELADLAGRTVHAQALPVEGGDTVLVLRDDTHVRHLETVRRDFVANVSHELRTPVTAISLIVDTLENGALEDKAAAREFVRRIGLEVSHLSQMVEELLALGRMESGQSTAIELDALPVHSIVKALERLQPLLAARHQTMDVDVPTDTPAIEADARLIEQLFRNLVHNASKYSADGAHIRFVARHHHGEATVRFQVSDDGVGIAPEDLPRIFERFWKADRSRQRDGEGNGLGLAIVRHAVEVHGGTITVESEPGRGATFTVTLPAVSPPDSLLTVRPDRIQHEGERHG